MAATTGPAQPQLCLGTAQIGERYGLASVAHDDASAMRLLDAALDVDVVHLDTAAAYGESERRIGLWRAQRPEAVARTRLFSKLAPIAVDVMGREAAIEALDRSCARLGTNRLAGYMAHRARDAMRADVRDALVACRDEGRTGLVGASVYTVQEANAVLALGGYDFLQLPVSLFNLAARDDRLIECANRHGVAVHARSIFVQGLLLHTPTDLPAHLAEAAPVLRRLDSLAREAGTTRVALAIAAVARIAGVELLVVGADSPAQVRELVAAAKQAAGLSLAAIDEAEAIAGAIPAGLADPRLWPKRTAAEHRS